MEEVKNKFSHRWILGIVMAYVLAAFLWWTIEHIRSSREIYELRDEQLTVAAIEMKMHYKRTFKENMTPEQRQDFLTDVAQRIPDLGITGGNWNEQDVAQAKISKLEEIEQVRDRKTIMYILEGIVMILILIWGINRIAKSLSQSLEFKRQQNNFLLSVTHEFKTPLASMRLMLQTMMMRQLDEDMRKNLFDKSLQELNRLESLVEQVLFAARLDGHIDIDPQNKVHLSALTAEIGSLFEGRFAQKNIEFSHKIKGALEAVGDESALKSVFSNLVDNALKYTPNGGIVAISLRKDENQAVFEVADTGPGIPEGEYDKLFRKFYRIGNEETRSHKGTGLGLYIVKRLAEAHGGSVSIGPNLPKGSVFTVRIPLAQVAVN